MEVLFVYRGIGLNLDNPVVIRQYGALQKLNIQIDLFPLRSSGVFGYIKEYIRLKKFLRHKKYALIHAHYSYSAFISGLLHNKKVVCSLMGSDIFNQSLLINYITAFFYKFIWSAVITKSPAMQNIFPKSYLIPNGIDFEMFFATCRKTSNLKTGFNPEAFNIIFIAIDPKSKVKNLKLAKDALSKLSNDRIKLHILSDKNQIDLNDYYNSADLLLLTSYSEGSPNVIKEAMACNLSIVSTDVGDVKELIKETNGCYICSYDPRNVADKIQTALHFNKRTNGRDYIKHLDDEIISKRIYSLYQSLIDAKTEK